MKFFIIVRLILSRESGAGRGRQERPPSECAMMGARVQLSRVHSAGPMNSHSSAHRRPGARALALNHQVVSSARVV